MSAAGSEHDGDVHMRLADALRRAPAPGKLAAEMARLRGDVDVEFYAPDGADVQRPHDRDELYAIARGSGTLRVGSREYAFQAGDVLWVPAHADHRFERFSGEFATWVGFYGPVV